MVVSEWQTDCAGGVVQKLLPSYPQCLTSPAGFEDELMLYRTIIVMDESGRRRATWMVMPSGPLQKIRQSRFAPVVPGVGIMNDGLNSCLSGSDQVPLGLMLS